MRLPSNLWPVAVLAALAAALFGHRRWRERQRHHRRHVLTDALQTWEAEGGALPPAQPSRSAPHAARAADRA